MHKLNLIKEGSKGNPGRLQNFYEQGYYDEKVKNVTKKLHLDYTEAKRCHVLNANASIATCDRSQCQHVDVLQL